MAIKTTQEIMEDYSKAGWIVLAVPPEFAEDIIGIPANEHTAAVFSARLMAMQHELAHWRPSTQAARVKEGVPTQELVCLPEMPLKDFLNLFLMDDDASITFIRDQPTTHGVQRTRIAWAEDGSKQLVITQTVEDAP
jgi:hypothetical protein